MTTVTASQVKELRDRTGAGMMDCKNALIENKGDMEQSVDWLRKKGLSKAAKKAGRVAADGLIGLEGSASQAALVEVNSETDFVARNPQFQDMVRDIASLASKAGGDLARLLALPYPGKKVSVEDHVKEMVSTIGENLTVRRTGSLSVKEGIVSTYMHNQAAPGLGKIGVLVALGSKGDKGKLGELGRQLAMHIAAANPQVVTADQLDAAMIEKERAIYMEQAKAEPKNAGKSEANLAKAIEGRLRKEFVQQAVLMEQVYVIDGKEKVESAIKAAEKAIGAPIKVEGFVRYALGEGIDKKEEDFAAEVAKAAKGD
jgi:elongation factor Ts